MPVIVTVFEVCDDPAVTLVSAVNENAFGVVLGAAVVTRKLPETPETVSVAVVVVEKLADDVCRRATVLPFTIVPAAVVNAPPFTLYEPPVAEIGTAAVMPVIVTVFDVTTVLRATLVCGVKLNGFGVWAVVVVTLKPALTVDTVSVAMTVAPAVLEAVSRTATVLPLEIVPAALVNAPPFKL
jgi:hypothetical protein